MLIIALVRSDWNRVYGEIARWVDNAGVLVC